MHARVKKDLGTLQTGGLALVMSALPTFLAQVVGDVEGEAFMSHVVFWLEVTVQQHFISTGLGMFLRHF